MWPSAPFRPQISSSSSSSTLFASLLIIPHIAAFTFTQAPEPNIDLSQLGSVGLAGSFDGLSLYQYLGQDEDGLSPNGSASVLSRLPDGQFISVSPADGAINSMCQFSPSNPAMGGVLVGGNFTSLGGQQAAAAALLDPNTGRTTSLPGLSGSVNTILCDGDTAYFGGLFQSGNITNAISWTSGWTNLPFAGFNGPVNTIARLPNGHILYGGSFTGVGNNSASGPPIPDAQTIPLSAATITSGPNTTVHPGFEDPRNIICRTPNDTDNGWLLSDGVKGYWRADFGFNFMPTKVRLYNSQFPNYSTTIFSYTFFPNSGLANLTFYDDQGLQWCTDACPLPPQGNTSYQDFYFVNPLPMSGFQLNIEGFNGTGAGLGGIELFQNEIFSYAINDFNEPQCDGVSRGVNSTVNGNFTITPPGEALPQYLTTNLPRGTADGDSSDVSVVFRPDIQTSGNYTILLFTPGCVADNSCDSRGSVNITGTLGSPTTGTASSSNVDGTLSPTQVSQQNRNDKYDPVYYGYVGSSTGSFRPSVTLTPTQGQEGNLTVVASYVQFILQNSTGGLNGLYDYNPNIVTASTDFSNSPFDSAATQLDNDAIFNQIVVVGNTTTYAAGAFTSRDINNIMSMSGSGNATALPGGGLDAAVQTMMLNDTILYMGGNFSATSDNQTTGFNNIAAFDTAQNTWQKIGAGVDGSVLDIVPVSVNVSATETVDGVAFSGFFSRILAFGPNPALTVQDVAIWIPSQNNWLQNLPNATTSLMGRLSAQTAVDNQAPLFAGSVDSQTLSSRDASELQSSNGLSLAQVPIKINAAPDSTQNNVQKRAVTGGETQGVMTGFYYSNSSTGDLMILGGQFTAPATNGSTVQNLAIVNASDSNAVTGLLLNSSDTDSVVYSVLAYQGLLFAGGAMPGGFVEYDLLQSSPSSPQPPPLTGGSATVAAIAAQTSTANVYFGGNFVQAGSLSCPSLCIWDLAAQQWNSPGPGLDENSTVNAMTWANDTTLIVVGDLVINQSPTSMASYDVQSLSWMPFPGAGDPANVPGPITAFSATDDSYDDFLAAGTSSNGTIFLTRYNSNGTWTPASTSQPFGAATIIDSVQIVNAENNHDSTPLVDSSHVLLITGLLQMPVFGSNVSAALFNGTTFEPFVLSTRSDGSAGRIRQMFVEYPQNFLKPKSSSHLAVGFIVLIALGIALALIFLLVVAGILAERWRRRREGYVPAPTAMPFEKISGRMGTVSPERLFGSAGTGR